MLRGWAIKKLSDVELEQAQEMAEIISDFSVLIWQFPFGSKATNIEIAITGYEVILNYFTLTTFPSEWAKTQNRLGNAYLYRVKSNKAENFVGSCNRVLFEMWLEDCLLPRLEPGDVIVIDNASFHRSLYIEEVVAASGCELWYLPAYSPDLNAIEHWWFVLKNWMRQRWHEFESFRECVDAAFRHCPKVNP